MKTDSNELVDCWLASSTPSAIDEAKQSFLSLVKIKSFSSARKVILENGDGRAI